MLLCYYVLCSIRYYVFCSICYYVLCSIRYHVLCSICYYVLRELGVFVEVGLALLQEGAAAFLRLVEGVVEHCGVTGELLDTCLSVELSVEASLHHADGERRALHDRLAPGHRLILELVNTTLLTSPICSASFAEY